MTHKVVVRGAEEAFQQSSISQVLKIQSLQDQPSACPKPSLSCPVLNKLKPNSSSPSPSTPGQLTSTSNLFSPLSLPTRFNSSNQIPSVLPALLQFSLWNSILTLSSRSPSNAISTSQALFHSNLNAGGQVLCLRFSTLEPGNQAYQNRFRFKA